MANIVLAGFDATSAKQFADKLAKLRHTTEICLGDSRSIGTRRTDLVFLSGDDVRCQRDLESLRLKSPGTPAIVVSRTAEDARWLSALESGATDYCPADVDLSNLSWMIENALRPRAFAGAA